MIARPYCKLTKNIFLLSTISVGLPPYTKPHNNLERRKPLTCTVHTYIHVIKREGERGELGNFLATTTTVHNTKREGKKKERKRVVPGIQH